MNSSNKRVLDIAAAIVVGAGLGLPSLVGATFATHDGGPALFRQKRYSHGLPFEILKIRTMFVGAEKDEPEWVGHEDSRVTWIGGLLRKTSLDEVPQLVNVLRGDISMVGYRPPSDRDQDRMSAQTHLYDEWLDMTRLCKAGITGIAQLRLKKTPIHDAKAHVQKMRDDLVYAETASFSKDIKILAATFGAMVETSDDKVCSTFFAAERSIEV